MKKNQNRYLPVIVVLVLVLAGLTIFNSQSPYSIPNLNLTALVAGDSLHATEPKKGYLYSCKSDFSERSLRPGGWFDRSSKVFSLQNKPTVSGEVVWNSVVQMAETGNKRIISTNALPPHKTGQFPPEDGDDAQKYDPSKNSIKPQNLSYGLVLNPTVADEPYCVGDEVGIALNGIPLYSPINDAGDDAVAREMLDSCGGRPDEAGIYHYYHLTDCWDQTSSNSDVVGYALDGFPIVKEKGVTSNQLDVCHGKTGTINVDGEEKETYHYVATADFPYLVSCFKGQPVSGSVSNLRQKAKATSESIPKYYSSQDKLLLPYLDELNDKESASGPLDFKWRKFLPAFTE